MGRTTIIRTLLWGLIIAAVGVQSTFAAETCNRVVAIVNDDIVTLHELNKKMQEFTGLAPEDLRFQDEERYLQTRRDVLERIINDRIAQEKIRELGIQVTEDQVDAAVAGLTSIIEPIIIGFLGIVVGFIVISLFLPIINITQII